MSAYVFETAVDYYSSTEFLKAIRKLVRELRRQHPELKSCSLADLALRKERTEVCVTLYFKERE